MTTGIRYCLILCDQLSVVQTLHSLNDTELYNTGVGSAERLCQLNELKREVLMLSTLHHPNILQLIGMDVFDCCVCCVGMLRNAILCVHQPAHGFIT